MAASQMHGPETQGRQGRPQADWGLPKPGRSKIRGDPGL